MCVYVSVQPAIYLLYIYTFKYTHALFLHTQYEKLRALGVALNFGTVCIHMFSTDKKWREDLHSTVNVYIPVLCESIRFNYVHIVVLSATTRPSDHHHHQAQYSLCLLIHFLFYIIQFFELFYRKNMMAIDKLFSMTHTHSMFKFD